VTCPNQIARLITGTRAVIFGAVCRDCPLRDSCTTSATGRTLRLHPHDALQRAHRARAQDPEFQAVYRRHRRMVERSISWLVAGGNRRLRFRGTRLNDLWLHHRAAALSWRSCSPATASAGPSPPPEPGCQRPLDRPGAPAHPHLRGRANSVSPRKKR
jgi:hypothetical protein